MGPTADGVQDLERETPMIPGALESYGEPYGESPLTPDEIESFQQSLEQLREWLLQSIAQIEASQQTSNNRLASLDGVDAALQNSIRQRALAEKRLLLHEVMRAFERIKENTYGRCVTDDSHIPRSLLEEVPWIRFCASCGNRNT